jgi:hydrogenase maturation factor HypF (carbamoyltransferase family)
LITRKRLSKTQANSGNAGNEKVASSEPTALRRRHFDWAKVDQMEITAKCDDRVARHNPGNISGMRSRIRYANQAIDILL